MSGSYRDLFTADGAASAYDEGQYGPGSYWDLLWELEKPILEGVLAELKATGRPVSYLDFACGSGRILSYLEDRCDEATGIDVSEEMLGRARTRVKRGRLLRRDITAHGSEVEGRYDLITAFRFLLNAEPELRRAGLAALASRLRDPDSRLVLNVHGNPLSYKALVWPLRRLRGLLGGEGGENLLSLGEARRLLFAAGLEVVAVRGMGIFPGRLWRSLPPRVGVAVEGALARAPMLPHLGVNQVLVCRLISQEP